MIQRILTQTLKLHLGEGKALIVLGPRQVGKTTTTVAYLLWTILFQDAQSIAVLANRGETARGILGKLQLAFYQCNFYHSDTFRCVPHEFHVGDN